MGFHITEINIENVMRLKVLNWKPGRHMNIIGGDNEQGKTSLLRAIDMLFSGAGALGPMPIRKDADGLRIHVELAGLPGKGLTIERTKDAETGRDSLTVTGEEGQSYGSPQGILNAIKNALLDPLAFSKMDAKKQRTVLMELLGLDFTELDAKFKGAEDRRRDFNREAKRLTANLKPMQEAAELVDVGALTKELSAAHESNRTITNRSDEIIRLCQRRDTLGLQIEALRKSLAEATSARDALTEEQDRAGCAIDTGHIQSQIDAAGEINARHEHNRLMTATKAEIEDQESKGKACDLQMKEIEADKQSQITNAKPPIDGLAVTDKCVMFDKGDGVGPIPFENCSGEQKLRISFAIMAGLKPDLQVALIQDGSLLDDEHLAQLESMCEEFDIQALVERVGTGDECALIIEDGEAVAT